MPPSASTDSRAAASGRRTAPPTGGHASSILAWQAALRTHRSLVLLIAAYTGAGYLVQALTGIEGMMRPLWEGETFLLFYGVAAYSAVVVLVVLRWRVRDAEGRRIRSRDAWRLACVRFRELIASERGAGALLVIAILPLFMNAFASWKAAIPAIHAFSWDPTLMRVDRLVHGGIDPWRFLAPLLSRPRVVLAWDYGYTLFIPVQTAVVLWQVWSGDDSVRQRFLRSYVLTWVLLGTVAAIFLSSAGPCFYGELVTGTNPYEPLFRTLGAISKQHPLGALEAQHVLWESFRKGLAVPFAGISAMPSMHIALPTLFVLAMWKANAILRVLFVSYLAFNLVGSVLLGWHYAIDGYAAMLGTTFIWVAAGRWTGPAQHHAATRVQAV